MLCSQLDELLGRHWNFDLEDCDHILRVIADDLLIQNIVDILVANGFSCEELEDKIYA